MKKKILASLMILGLNQVIAAPLDVSLNTELHINKIEHMGIKGNIYSAHSATVTNNTDKLQYIYAYYSLCIELVCESKHTRKYKIAVNPHSTWHDHLELHMNPYFTDPRYYYVTAMTGIMDNKGYDITPSKIISDTIEVKRIF